jgi:hypothetical protein
MLVGLAIGLVTKDHKTHLPFAFGFTADRTKDCEVAVSNDLVGFYCASNKLLFYHKKSNFESNDLSTIVKKDVSAYSSATSHSGNRNMIITATLGEFSHFTVAYLNGANIDSTHYYIRGYSPINFAFGDDIFVDVTKSTSSGVIKWMIGILNDSSYRTVYLLDRAIPSGIALRDVTPKSKARIYYTLADPATLGYILYKEDSDLQFNLSNKSQASVGKNCGSKIVVNSNIIVLSCPSTSSATEGIISVYKESDLSFIHTITSTSSQYFIGKEIKILSSAFYVSTSY